MTRAYFVFSLWLCGLVIDVNAYPSLRGFDRTFAHEISSDLYLLPTELDFQAMGLACECPYGLGYAPSLAEVSSPGTQSPVSPVEATVEYKSAASPPAPCSSGADGEYPSNPPHSRYRTLYDPLYDQAVYGIPIPPSSEAIAASDRPPDESSDQLLVSALLHFADAVEHTGDALQSLAEQISRFAHRHRIAPRIAARPTLE